MGKDKRTIQEKIANLNKSLIDCCDKSAFVEFDKLKLDHVDGTAPKMFARCSGKLLRDMYRELVEKPHNNYVTCMDLLIYDKDFSEQDFENTRVSCIVKGARENKSKYIRNELICSRLAEILGVKTCYIAPFPDAKNKCICVDFLSGEQETKNLFEFTNNPFVLLNDVPISIIGDALMSGLKRKLRKELNNEEIVSSVMSDFIHMYLVKRFILKETDYTGRNISIINSKGKKDYSLAPCYDYELCFLEKTKALSAFNISEDDILKDSITYFNIHFPTQLEQVINRLNAYCNENSIKDVFRKFATAEPQKVDKCASYITNNLEKINSTYTSLLDFKKGKENGYEK